MVKHTQTIRLSVFDHFVGLALKGLIMSNEVYRTDLIMHTPSTNN